MEKNLIVRGVAFEDQITRVTVLGLNNALKGLSTIFTTLAQNQINVDIIIQSRTEAESVDLSFSIKSNDLTQTLDVLEKNKDLLSYRAIESETGLAKVSIVGSGMISNPGVAAKMFEILEGSGVQVKMVSTSEIKVSTVIAEKQMVNAVESLHEAFELFSAPVNLK